MKRKNRSLRPTASGPIKKSRSALCQQGPGHPRFPGLKVLHEQLALLQSASASLGLVEAVAIRHSLVKVRLPVLGVLPSTGRVLVLGVLPSTGWVLVSCPWDPLRTCLRIVGFGSHRNPLPST